VIFHMTYMPSETIQMLQKNRCDILPAVDHWV
jgi:hypothetical protein